ncbi:serine hydrolase domain-containing protein [Bailinhaonella thermotolerans]|uniref:Class A beta-lactamase-related serine hydrolase n=1 Tax=Bailinhaonella thermotolerans TaxID=1070861 RepID=A0A3A4ARQ2_9ACTN|nr:serine hydrolase domain-containing protein [Bailinhaonella thermotolerans]RJL31289.1 class A beta-lactamase-related serine hydrolase [Bailinhaonella thermotolerans]
MRNRVAAAVTALLAAGAVVAPGSASAAVAPAPAGLTASAVDAYVKDYMARTGLPGAVVAVTKGDQVVRTAGYGHDAGGKALTEASPMPVASMSKSFTALGVTRLAEAGRVELDAPVRRYLPEFRMADPRAEKITVRQLLEQTSGMADSEYPELALAAPGTLKEAVANLRGASLAGAPGEKTRYHNPNYAVAARLVEVVTGRDFAGYMRDAVFTPLGMRATTTVNTTDELPGAGRGYVRAYRRVIERDHSTMFVNGAFGVVSTAGDLARWLIAQNGADPAVKATHGPPGAPDHTYGMGWWTGKTPGGSPRLSHTGWLLTHNSAQIVLPASGYGVAVVANTGFISGDDALLMAEELAELAEGRTPSGSEPFTMTADPVLAVLTLVALALGVLGVRRSRAWAGRRAARPLWRAAVRLAPHALPVAGFLGLGALFGLLMNRAATLGMITYAWPALYVFFAAMSLASVSVVAARLVHLVRLRRAGAVRAGHAVSGAAAGRARV